MLEKVLQIPDGLGLETLLILLVLVALEAVLSADNAIALAAIAKGLEDPKLQRNALNFGLLIAYILRVVLIVTATWIIQFWEFQVMGAIYLLWLVFRYYTSEEDENHHHHGPRFNSLLQAIPMIAVTDLAFSLDSVTTAIAVSDRLWLIILGGTIGIIALRFMAGLFLRWLKEYPRLEDAGYLTVACVGGRLLLKALVPSLAPPEWIMITLIGIIFAWGFSMREANPTLE